MHELPLITTVAVAFTAAWLLGLLTQRIGLSPIVGYLVAGVLIGPHTPGFVGDVEIAQQLAEFGVILLMFGVGLHFHLKDLLAVKSVAIPGAVGQALVATLLGTAVCVFFGFSPLAGVVIGVAMAVASTVVLMRVLLNAGVLSTPQGHIAVGWLLVEDVLTVLVLIMIPVLGNDAGSTSADPSTLKLWAALGMALINVAMLVLIVLLAGSRIIPWVLVQVARLRSRELFTLTVLVISVAIAAGSYALFGASMALGAFLAGMVVGQTPVSHQAAADALPLRDAFSVLFFVSVGMLFDPAFLLEAPLLLAASLCIVLIAKPLAAIILVALLGHSSLTALTVAVGLAQIGEFSFILADLAVEHNVIPDDGQNLLVVLAIISIALNPLIFRSIEPFEAWLRRHPRVWSLLNSRAERRAMNVNAATQARVGQRVADGKRLAIVVGFGPVGRSVHRLLTDAGLTTVVIDLNVDTVTELGSQNQLAVFGDASREGILAQAGMECASHLVLTLPHAAARIAVVTAARNLNSDARVLVRAHYLRERDDLEKAGATAAVFEEAEVAVALARLVLANTGTPHEQMEQKIRALRLQLILENMSNIESRPIQGIMVPWAKVQTLSTSLSRKEVLRALADQRYSRWPVTESATGRVVGYLLTKDLIADTSVGDDWYRLVRTLHVVSPNDDIQSTLLHMQSEEIPICVVEELGVPLGLVTLEDVLEQIVGRIEDEFPHEPRVSLYHAMLAGGVILDLRGRTRDELIREMAGALPVSRLLPNMKLADLAIEREREVSTDLGVGVAVPHVRCAHLSAPQVVFGRTTDAIRFSPEPAKPVCFVFLLVTPLDQSDVQLSLLAQIARIAGDDALRQRLHQAKSEAEVLQIVAGTDV